MAVTAFLRQFVAPCAAALVLAVAAEAQTGPRVPRRLAEIRLNTIPTTVTFRGRPVHVRYPADPDARALGGSGGPIIEIVVTPSGNTPAVVFETQSIGLALVESTSSWPAFEVWSNAGGGTYTRAVYTWRSGERQYCSDRADEFDDDVDESATHTVRVIGSSRVVRFTRSRRLDCQR